MVPGVHNQYSTKLFMKAKAANLLILDWNQSLMNYFFMQEPTNKEKKSKPSTPQKRKPIKYDKKDKNKTVGQVLDDLENDKFVCYYCDKIFMGQPFLQDHRKRHFDENGYLPSKLHKTLPAH
jgi:hypothetical protein